MKMVYFPTRKCYHVAKVTSLVLFVVAVLALFEQWRGGKRGTSAFTDPEEAEFERQILEDEARIIPGLGEGGVAAYLSGEDKRRGEESEKKLAMNVYLSDRIAYNRTLKDHRNPACKRVVYDAELPSASVILIFHNEPYSVVVRTIWSVINSCRRSNKWFQKANFVDNNGKTMNLGYPGQDPNSPLVYLKEIILVDDNSTLPELKGKLSHYVRTRLPPDLIRILRLPDRVGIPRARMFGAIRATAEVLVFLDSHCEGNIDWMRPLLSRIKDSRTAVLTPLIDNIDTDTFKYDAGNIFYYQGLMQARITGARAARGDVLIFLDAHCEAEEDWIRPLLQRIRHKRDAVLTPIIDVIDQSGFQIEAADNFQVGGFTFTGHFTWIDVPEREKKRRGSDIAPTWSPTMAGGLFAINRAYYWELGAYDEQMAGWGGENLEMSFRIWQCGGTLETIPCSRVGHVFRSFHPYGLPEHTDTHGVNTARVAEVWMDEYAELFYMHRPDLRNNPKIGDVTHRKILREKLQCKSFQWYLDNIYKEKFVPVRDAYGYGRFQNPTTGLCLDTLQREADEAPLGLYQCHAQLQATQYLILSLEHELRTEDDCAHAQYRRRSSQESGDYSKKVLMSTCRGKSNERKFTYNPATKQIRHADGLCLDAAAGAGADVLLRTCSAAATQQWKIDYSEDNDFKMSNEVEPNDQQIKLSRLRGQKRISRSLLSYEPHSYQNSTVRRHTHRKHKKHAKKKKTKNKFILKLIRTLSNNSEEHLEVDVHCKHRQLYPNNSFVRDLVTILNDRDIKVINNGRVFEKNKVTQLDGGSTRQRILNKMDIVQQAAATIPAVEQKAHHPVEKKNRKKPKLQSLPAQPPAEAPLLPIAPPQEPELGSETGANRIIIEDFVELTPTNTMRPKHNMKKRKRKHQAQAPGFLDARDNQMTQKPRDFDDQMGVPVQSEEGHRRPQDNSGEDAPMLSDRDDQRKPKSSSEDEYWHVGESRYRRNNSEWRRQRLRSEDRRDNEDDQSSEVKIEASREGGPVKVVVKSNLTFNLGDEFFNQDSGSDRDFRQRGNDISIPSHQEIASPSLARQSDNSYKKLNVRTRYRSQREEITERDRNVLSRGSDKDSDSISDNNSSSDK